MENKLLVTGGSGFLGRAVVSALAQLRSHAKLLVPSHEQLDISDETAVRTYWQQHKPTGLVHLAAFARGLGGNLQAREFAFLRNERLIRAPLLAALEFGVQEVFFAGTVAEYAYPYTSLPLVENDILNGPPHFGESYYAHAKRLGDGYLSAIEDRWEASVTHGLLTNMYGPNDRFDPDSGHVVAAMLKKFAVAKAMDSPAVSLWGHPGTTRDFMYVADAATCVVNLLGTSAGRVNIGTGTTNRMVDVARIIQQVIGYAGNIEWDASKPVGIENRSLNIDRLRTYVNFAPIGLREGIEQTVLKEPWLRDS